MSILESMRPPHFRRSAILDAVVGPCDDLVPVLLGLGSQSGLRLKPFVWAWLNGFVRTDRNNSKRRGWIGHKSVLIPVPARMIPKPAIKIGYVSSEIDINRS